jgi:hypothetical protein
MATTDSSAPAHPPSEEETPHGCYEGWVYLGLMVEDPDTGIDLEVVEAVPCRRCGDSR